MESAPRPDATAVMPVQARPRPAPSDYPALRLLFLAFCCATALTLLFLLSTLGFGLLVSTLVGTQQQAMMFSAFVLMVPMIYLSGLIFPIENMPLIFQYASYLIPVRYYAVILRGVFLKGAGLDVLWRLAPIEADAGSRMTGCRCDRGDPHRCAPVSERDNPPF